MKNFPSDRIVRVFPVEEEVYFEVLQCFAGRNLSVATALGILDLAKDELIAGTYVESGDPTAA